MVPLSESKVRYVLVSLFGLNDGRCREIDADACRCLRRSSHRGPHDFPWTPWCFVPKERAP